MNLIDNTITVFEPEISRKCSFGQLNVSENQHNRVLPLSKVSVKASVINLISTVTHIQIFENPFNEHLEATYIFPLPGGAVVSDFEMKIGDKIIKGEVKERQEARLEYNKAVSDGKKAALLEQERDDIFTVQVGNIPPEKEIQVTITYSEKLPFFENGSTEIRLPMVTAPRYIPGDELDRSAAGKGVVSDTDLVPDASRITPPRLVPGFDPKIDLSIAVEIVQNENQAISELNCSQHASKTSISSGGIKVELSNKHETMDRDFILRWQLSNMELKNDLAFYNDDKGNIYGLLTIIPPKQEKYLEIARDVVFIIDHSGSMEGIKMTSAARACSILLDTLGPKDRFAILAFDDQLNWFEPDPKDRDNLFLNADIAGIDKGNKFLREIRAAGGTELDEALGGALYAFKDLKDNHGRMPIAVLLTDGQIGDESRVLKRIQKEIGDTRIFTIGIDTAVNENFLKRLAVLGGGTSAFVVPGEQLETALTMIGRDIGNPVLVDINIKDENCGIIDYSVVPVKVPDLFASRAVNVFFKAKNPGKLIVTGKYYNGDDFYSLISGNQVNNSAIPQLWAKTKIFDLEDQYRIAEADFNTDNNKNTLKQEIIELSIKHSVLTRFTAFIAVDQDITNESGDLRKIVQPVSEPANWEMNRMRSLSMPMPAAAPAPVGKPPSIMAKTSFKALGKTMFDPSSFALHESDDIEFSASGGQFDAFSIHEQVMAPSGAGVNPPLNQNKPGLIKQIFSIFKSKNNPEVNLIKEQVIKLLSAFENIMRLLLKGQEAFSIDFETAKTNLMKTLQDSELAQELPALQFFLRKDAIEIITALNSKNNNYESIYKAFGKYRKSIENIKAEIKLEDNFWEETV